MEKTILLVCEGPTDEPIFQAIADKLSNKTNIYKFNMIAPQIDATSGSADSFGWGNVCNWCIANNNKIDMFLEFDGAESLFIHMDTDIAGDIDPDYTKKGVSARQCCENRLNNCLGVNTAPNNCHYILPTQKTETWLLAQYDNLTHPSVFSHAIVNYESISDVDQKLIAIGYSQKKGKLRKEINKYMAYGKSLANNLLIARNRCIELDNLCTAIGNI